MSLNGKKILSTCSEDKEKKIYALFQSKGAEIINSQMLEINKTVRKEKSIRKTLRKIDTYNWIIFTSSNGVNSFFYWAEKCDIKLNPKQKIAVIGKSTGKTLKSFHKTANYTSKAKSSKEFATELSKTIKEKAKILIPSGNLASKNIKSILEPPHKCKYLTVYNTEIKKQLDSLLLNRIENNFFDLYVFMSPSSVKGLLNNLPNNTKLEKLKCVAIGKTTAKSLKEKNINPFFVPSKPDIETMVNELDKL